MSAHPRTILACSARFAHVAMTITTPDGMVIETRVPVEAHATHGAFARQNPGAVVLTSALFGIVAFDAFEAARERAASSMPVVIGQLAA